MEVSEKFHYQVLDVLQLKLPQTKIEKLSMKAIIKAKAPTVYQLNSLTAFGMCLKQNANGSFSASMEFDGKEEAQTYLRNRARAYNDADHEGNDQRLNDMFSDIESGRLTLDAVTAYIE